MDNLPQDTAPISPTPAPAEPAEPVYAPMESSRPWWYSKKVWSAAAVLLVLIGILSFVPAGKIPFLRQLMYAMGYSYEEGQKTSFLKALLSWNEHRKILRGELPDPNAVLVFGSDGGAFNSAAGKAQNKLFDLNSVNAALVKSGKKADKLAGSYNDPAQNAVRANGASGEDDEAVRIGKQDAVANTQANAQKADVFFGEDSSIVARDKKDGFNSVNILKKVAVKPVAGHSGNDWLDRVIDKAVRSDTDLSSFVKSMDHSGSSLAQIGGVAKVGDSRAKRDMYWAWLMGRAARRTPQTLLKKTLASASFDGAEMPRSVFTSSGFSGVGIKPDDVLSDMDSVQQYLDQDKNCQAAMNQTSQMTNPDGLGEQISHLTASSFPATCSDVGGNNDTYMGTLQGIENSCSQMHSAYEQIQKQCATLDIALNGNQCHSDKLTSYYDDFVAMCGSERAKCEQMEDPEEQAQCLTLWKDFSSSEKRGEYQWDINELEHERDQLMYEHDQSGNATGRLNTDFFPGVNWGGSRLWIDGNAAN